MRITSALTGLTGMPGAPASGWEVMLIASSIGSRVELLRKQTSLPICVGFGISTPEQARAVAQQADGAVVGSVLVNRIAEWGREKELPQKLEAFARPLAQAIHEGKAESRS